jgi:hypothetical protein
MDVACNLLPSIDECPSLETLFREKGLTRDELDKLLSYMEWGISHPDVPGVVINDLVSIHGDAILIYADMVGPEHV